MEQLQLIYNLLVIYLTYLQLIYNLLVTLLTYLQLIYNMLVTLPTNRPPLLSNFPRLD